jgi:hypothetical protein
MTTIVPFLRYAAFDAETTKSLAFDEACRGLHDQPDLVKEISANGSLRRPGVTNVIRTDCAQKHWTLLE